MWNEICLLFTFVGELPPEIPLNPGEPLPTIRKRVGTEFKLSEDLLKQDSKDGLRANLELELEIQNKITAAALKLFQGIELVIHGVLLHKKNCFWLFGYTTK